MNCSEILRETREAKGLNQVTVAKIINTTQQQYSKYEKGHAEIPVKALIILADYYKVSADYLLGRVSYSSNFTDLEKFIGSNDNVAQLLSDLQTLNEDSKSSVFEYVKLQILKEKSELFNKSKGR